MRPLSCLLFLVGACMLTRAEPWASQGDERFENAETYQFTYGGYVFGVPVGIRAEMQSASAGTSYRLSSDLTHAFAQNHHVSLFRLEDCDYTPEGYHNHGRSPGWRFNDRVVFDVEGDEIHYEGATQRPGQKTATDLALSFPWDDAVYVDKLSQFSVLGCYLARGDREIFLSYVDDTVGRYRFTPEGKARPFKVGQRTLSGLPVRAVPVEFEEGSIHTPVRYWLSEELGFMPIKISTKLNGLRLSVRLLDTNCC